MKNFKKVKDDPAFSEEQRHYYEKQKQLYRESLDELNTETQARLEILF